MNSGFQKVLKDVSEELNSLPTKEEKLETLIYFGKQLNGLSEEQKSDENRVPGCTSDTYLTAQLNQAGNVIFNGDSNSLIVKGYLYIFTEAFNNISPKELLSNIDSEIQDFVQFTEIDTSLMPSRTNTFLNIVEQMKRLTSELYSQNTR